MKILKMALRALLHYRMYNLINLLGLAMSLACVIIIARYVHGELTVEHFNKKLDRIYISSTENSNNPGKLLYSGIINMNNEKAFRDLSEHPGVEKHALFYREEEADIQLDNHTYSTDMLIVDTNFLQILDYPVIAGVANLTGPDDAFISEAYAEKLFGSENPVGRKLFFASLNRELTVVGLIGKPRTKSLLSFDMLVSSLLQKQWMRMPQSLILLYPGVNYRDINEQYGEFMEMARWGYGIRYRLHPYRDVYFDRQVGDYLGFLHGNRTYVFILSAVGILLLLTGVVNYINIYTVVILRRNREFGLKKVFGAEGRLVFAQLLFENLYLIAAALLLAFGLVATAGPAIQRFFEFEQYPDVAFDAWLALLLLLLLPCLTGLAPYLRYRHAPPVQSLRAVAAGGKSLFSRRFFLCFQYFITLTLVVVSLFFVKQLHFMLNRDLGYRTQNLVKVTFLKSDYRWHMSSSQEEQKAREEKRKQIVDRLKQKLDASPLVESWTWGQSPNQSTHTYEFKTEGGELMPTTLVSADEAWLGMFDIQLLDGRLWDNEKDNFMSYNIIVSESALQQFGITDWQTAELHPFRRLWYASGPGVTEDMSLNPPYRIVGVVKDFYTDHLSRKPHPIAIYFSKPHPSEPVIVAFAPEHRQEVVSFLQDLHAELADGEFSCTFVEDEVAAVYRDDRKVAVIYSVFTVIAIFISVLGLFGLSLFDVRQRRHEIAIRKVNGASTAIIIRLLLKRYFVLLIIAFAVSIPVALFAIHKYLENFAFKATVSWWLFPVAGIVTAAVSLLTLIHQTRKASNENLVEVLKTE
jgi:ABC-type antimicrobial peptide transport system permease subunit